MMMGEMIMGEVLIHVLEVSVVVSNGWVAVSNYWVADEERIPHPLKVTRARVQVVRVKITHVKIRRVR